MKDQETRRLDGTILIVDDVEANRNVIRRRLERLGYRIEEAASGKEALAMVSRMPPDLILLDYMMPGMSGVEVLHVLRKEWKVVALPVIMLTARTEADAQVTALQAGVDDYVTKPIDFGVLDARIQTQLTKFHAENALRIANQSLGNKAALKALTLSEVEDELRREVRLRMDMMTSGPDEGGQPKDREAIGEAIALLQRAIEDCDNGDPPAKSTLVIIRDILQAVSEVS